MTESEAAEYLNVSIEYVRKILASGDLSNLEPATVIEYRRARHERAKQLFAEATAEAEELWIDD